MQTAIQLYTVRDVEKPLPEIIADVGEADFDGVEFAYRVEDADRDAVRTALDDAGLQAASAHIGIDAIEADLDAVVAARRHARLRRRRRAVARPRTLGRPSRRSEATAARLSGLAEGFVRGGADDALPQSRPGVRRDRRGCRLRTTGRPDRLHARTRRRVGARRRRGTPSNCSTGTATRISHVHLKDVNLDSDEVPALGEGTSTSPPSPRRPTKSGPSGSSTRTTSPRPRRGDPHGADVLSRHVQDGRSSFSPQWSFSPGSAAI